MSRKIGYDYYTIRLPGDLSDDPEVMGQQAISEAKEQARKYRIPCDWQATLTQGTIGDSFEVVYRVVRRYAKQA